MDLPNPLGTERGGAERARRRGQPGLSGRSARWGLSLTRLSGRSARRGARLFQRPALLAVAAVSGWNLWSFRATRLPVAYLYDASVHSELVRFAASAIEAGRLPYNAWFPYTDLGSAQFLQYQSLAAVVAGLAGALVGPGAAFRWSTYLLVSLWPFAVYASARLFGFSRGASAASGLLSPFVVSYTGIAFERGAYSWTGGAEVWTQLFGSWALVFALAFTWRALSDSRYLWAGAALSALTIAFHFESGYLALLGTAVFGLSGTGPLSRRLPRSAVVFAGSFVAAAWVLVPLVTLSRWASVDEPLAGTPYVRGYGARQELTWLFTGQIFDARRALPVISVAVAIGAAVALACWRSRPLLRCALLFGAVSLALSFGPTTFGPLADLVPAHRDLFFRRFEMGAQLAGVYLAGEGVMAAWLAWQRLVGWLAWRRLGRSQACGRFGHLKGWRGLGRSHAWRELGRSKAWRGLLGSWRAPGGLLGDFAERARPKAGAGAGGGPSGADPGAAPGPSSVGIATGAAPSTGSAGPSSSSARTGLGAAPSSSSAWPSSSSAQAGLGAAPRPSSAGTGLAVHGSLAQGFAAVLFLAAAIAWFWPAGREVARMDSQDAAAIVAQRRADARLGPEIAPLITYVQSHGGGRVYAGLSGNWGGAFRIGAVPVFKYIEGYDVDEMTYVVPSSSLMLSPESNFDEANPADYGLFGVRYLLMPTGGAPPVPAQFVMSRGPFTLWRAPGSGYAEVVRVSGVISANRADVGSKTSALLAAIQPGEDWAVNWPGTPALQPPLSEHARAGAELAQVAGGRAEAAGSVSRARAQLAEGRLSVEARMKQPGVLLLSVSYNPLWHAWVDGKPAKTEVLAPALVGVPLTPGLHHIVLRFVGFGWYRELWALSALGVIVLWLAGKNWYPRRGFYCL